MNFHFLMYGRGQVKKFGFFFHGNLLLDSPFEGGYQFNTSVCVWVHFGIGYVVGGICGLRFETWGKLRNLVVGIWICHSNLSLRIWVFQGPWGEGPCVPIMRIDAICGVVVECCECCM